MRAPHYHHITINGEPLCERLGSIAGRETQEKAGGVKCGHESGAGARRGVKALRPYFAEGVKIRAVAGFCPSLDRLMIGDAGQ